MHTKTGFFSFFRKAKRILRYLKPYWKLSIFLFLIAIVLSLLSLAGPYLVKLLIDDIIPAKNFGMLSNLMLLFIGIFFFRTLVEIYQSYKTTYLGESIVLDVKRELFAHLENLDIGFFHTNKVGDILYRLDEDVYSIDSFIDIIVDTILMNMLTAIFILIICLKLNWKVTVSSLLFFPFYLVAQKYYSAKISKQKEEILRRMSDLYSFLEENLAAIATIKSFVLETLKLREFTLRNRAMLRMNLRMDLLESASSSIVGLITFVPLLIILWYGSYKVIAGALSLGSLIAIYTYIGKLFAPVSSLGSINVAIQSTMVSVNRVFNFMDREEKIKDAPNAIEAKDIMGKIEFRHINFQYNEDEKILSDISFTINSGEVVGLVGPSGAGKSTVGSLICRFFDPASGSILLDERDLKTYKTSSLRSQIGIVSQEPTLFNTTLKNNIRVGKPNATDEEVVRAAKLAHIHDFIRVLDHGYATVVGERGARLSGGEKQRISIARVILKNPKILILDEATSSLDSESERKIQQALQYVTKGRTTLIIAHRLSTLRFANRILVLKDHHLAEEGTFDELIRKKGVFYQYYETQMKK